MTMTHLERPCSGENACGGPEWTAFGKESKIKFDQNVLEMVFPNAG
jgi:hypothetical protein